MARDSRIPKIPGATIAAVTRFTADTDVSQWIKDYDQKNGINQPEVNQGISNGSFEQANQFVMDNLIGLNDTGTASLIKKSLANKPSSIMQEFTRPEDDPDELPVGPGQAYLTHLFNHHDVKGKIKKAKEKEKSHGSNIYTDQQEALKMALNVVGLYSDKNPGGMPIEINEAKKFWFGEKEVNEVEEAEWRTNIEGDSKIDPRRVRKFVNYDGSLTWEVLNDDKTVMSRFTMGDYNGTKIFSQGGYKKFAELFKKAKEQIGADSGGEFDSIRNMFGGE